MDIVTDADDALNIQSSIVGNKLTIMVDNETIIEVAEYGSDGYKWRMTGRPSENYYPMATMQDMIGEAENGWFNAAQSFGKFGKWFGPKEFAYAILGAMSNY